MTAAGPRSRGVHKSSTIPKAHQERGRSKKPQAVETGSGAATFLLQCPWPSVLPPPRKQTPMGHTPVDRHYWEALRPEQQLQLFQPQSSDKPQIFSPKCPQTKPPRKF